MKDYFIYLLDEQINKCKQLMECIPYPFNDSELYPLAQRCESLLKSFISNAEYLLQYIDDFIDEEVYRHIYREFKTLVRSIEYVEMYGISVLKLSPTEIGFINKILNRIHKESNIPLPIATLANFSDKYFFYAPTIDVIFIPLIQHNFLLHLPDIYHELGHYVSNKSNSSKLVNVRNSYDTCLSEIKKHYQDRINSKIFEKDPHVYVNLLLNIHDMWKSSWLEELFCDAFAAYLVGPAYAWAHLHLMMKIDEEPYFFNLKQYKEHPSDEARLRFICACLEKIEFSEKAKEIRNFWCSLNFLNNIEGNEYYYQAFPDNLLNKLSLIVLDGLKKDKFNLYKNLSSMENNKFSYILNDSWQKLFDAPENYIKYEKQKVSEIRSRL